MSFNRTDSTGRCGHWTRDLGVYVRLVTTSLLDQSHVEAELLKVRGMTFNITTRTWSLSFQVSGGCLSIV